MYFQFIKITTDNKMLCRFTKNNCAELKIRLRKILQAIAIIILQIFCLKTFK